MEVHLSPELEKKVLELAALRGQTAGELVRDAVAGYVDEFAGTREMLDRRYDDIESGRVKLIPGDEIEAYFKKKAEDALRRKT